VPLQINMQVNAQLLHERFAQWTAASQKETEIAKNTESLPLSKASSQHRSTAGPLAFSHRFNHALAT
jgi:hypothetical protein